MMQKAQNRKKLWWILAAVGVTLIAAGICLVLFLRPAGGSESQQAASKSAAAGLYWNIDGKAFMENSESGLTTREPDERGVYTIRFVHDGEVIACQTTDAQLVNFIDTMELMGLVFDNSGYIVDAVKSKEAATELAKEMFVKICADGKLEVNSSMAMNGMTMEFAVTDELYIMDVRPDAPEIGAAVTLETMDKVTIYGDENGNATHVFFLERQPVAGVYIRVDKQWDSVNGSTSRQPDADGVYTIKMAHEGQQVLMKCKDKTLVTAIDSGDDANQFKGLYLDEEGYISDVVSVNVAIRGLLKCNVYHVTNIEGNTVTTERLLFHGGQVETFTIDEDTKIYNTDYLTDCAFDYVGQPVESLELYDRVIVYTDVFNTAKYVFLTKRLVDVPLYYNKTVMFDGTKQETSRPKDSKGYYVFEMGCEGKTVKLKTKDKELATQIERKYMQIMGIESENGIIKKIYDQSCVTGFLAVGNNRSVTELTGNIFRLVAGGDPENGANYVLSADAQIYNATQDYGTKFYQADTLQQYDNVTALRDIYGDVCYVLIQQRYQKNTKIYYNISRKYDSVNQVTTRVPDAEGYYVYDMLCDGQRVTVKTKNKEIATIIDRQYSPFAALKVSNGIVKAAYAAAASLPAGTKVANYNYVGKMGSDGTFNTYYYTNDGEMKWQTATFKKAKNCKIYNVSSIYDKTYGEKTTLKLHDQIQGFAANENQEVVAIYILSRKLDSPIYWPVNRQFDDTKLETTREPDAEGWYHVDLVLKGEIKTYKTKDKAVMSRVDSYTTGIAMEVNGDVILKAGAATSARDYGAVTINQSDVTKITDTKITAERTRPGASDYGLKLEGKLAKDCKVYDVSFYAENFGAPTTLSVGDRIIAYPNKDGKIVEIYVVYKNTHKDGAISRCPHCDKDVFWQPYLGVIYDADIHYYMAGDFLTWQRSVGKDDAGETTYDVVLDLNGKTLSSYGRNFLVYDKLTIMDLAGGGKLEGAGVDGWATSLLVLNGGELNITGGTVTTTAEAKTATQGGLIYAQDGCTVNITGGVLEKGKTSGAGGAIYLLNSTLNISGGVIRDCQAGNAKGIYLAGTSVANVSGTADISNIQVNASGLTLSGAPKLHELVIPDGVKLTLGELTEGTEITVAANGVFTKPHEKATDYQAYFKPALGYTQIKVADNALSTSVDTTISNDPLTFQAGTRDAWCSVCHKLVTWTPVTGEEDYVQMLGNHYYLANDIEVSAAGNGKEGYLYVSGGSNLGSVCLHLNDHNLTVTGHRAIMGGPRPLNVLGNGVVSGYSVGIGSSGAAVHVNAGYGAGVANLYGGTYTKAENDTESSILYIGYNGGTINMYEDVLVDATGKTSTTSAAGVHVQGGSGQYGGTANFNMYGGTIQNGITTKSGGNLNIPNQYGTATIYAGTITGGKAAVDGGNICCIGGTLLFAGDEETGNITVSNGVAESGEGGNLRIKDAKKLQIRYASFLGGEAASHGGNISIMRVPTTIEKGALIDGGYTKGYGGALRVYQTTVTMTDGVIKGGKCQYQAAHNVWLAGSAASPAVFVMSGGTIYATENHTYGGSGLYVFENSQAYLSGTAAIVDDGKGAGVRVSANCKLYICDGWSGSANVRWAEKYEAGATIPEANGQVVTVGENLSTTVGGSFTGVLRQLYDGLLTVVAQPDGSLLLTETE